MPRFTKICHGVLRPMAYLEFRFQKSAGCDFSITVSILLKSINQKKRTMPGLKPNADSPENVKV